MEDDIFHDVPCELIMRTLQGLSTAQLFRANDIDVIILMNLQKRRFLTGVIGTGRYGTVVPRPDAASGTCIYSSEFDVLMTRDVL
jgi:hypothetical protein